MQYFIVSASAARQFDATVRASSTKFRAVNSVRWQQCAYFVPLKQRVVYEVNGINLKLLTAICRHMLSIGILSGHIPVGRQIQAMVSWWEIWETYLIISSDNRGRSRLLVIGRYSIFVFHATPHEPRPFQDEEYVVHIVWPSKNGLLDCCMTFSFHSRTGRLQPPLRLIYGP